MKKILLLLLIACTLAGYAQKPVSTIRGEVNTKLPTNGANQIQAVKLREVFSDVLDHVDTLTKKKYGKTIAQIRLINNATYEMVFVLNSGKQGWFYYDSADTSTSDDNNNTIVSANGRRYKRSVLLESVTSVNGQTGVVVLTKEDVLGTIETTDIAPGAITYAKIQNVANQRVLGRNTAGAGVVEEVSLSQMLDWASSTRGTILYRGVSGWAALGPGTSGHFLQTAGAGADPLWASTSIANNSISDAMLRQSAGLSIIGRSANSTGNVADITAVTDGHVLRLSGTTLGFGTIATAGIANNAVTLGKLAQIANGNFLARISASTGDVESVSTAQVKTQLAVNNVDNTSDANKPVSTAQATAIGLKQDKVQYQNEGINTGTSGGVTTVNFVGPGVTVSNSGATNTVTIPGSGYIVGTGTQAVSTTSLTTIATTTLPASSIGATKPMTIRLYGRYLNNTGSNATVKFSFTIGGTTIVTDLNPPAIIANSQQGEFMVDINIIATSTTVIHGGSTSIVSNLFNATELPYVRNFNTVTVPSLSSSQTFNFGVTLSASSAQLWAQVDRFFIEY